MFNARRKALLKSSNWHRASIDYFEAWKHPGVEAANSVNHYHETLKDEEVADWLGQKGRFALLDESVLGQAEGVMRLIMCERLGYHPVSYAMSRDAFIALEEAFHLSPATLHIINSNNGMYVRNFTYSNSECTRPERINIIIKAPQKIQIGNYGLSLSHDFSTRTTTAFLHGWGVSESMLEFKEPSAPIQFDQILTLLESMASMWAHPLLIPTILLHMHITNLGKFLSKLSRDILDIEDHLDMVRAGRLLAKPKPERDPMAVGDIHKTRSTWFRVASELGTILAELTMLETTGDWDCKFSEFLLETNERLERENLSSSRELQSCIEHMSTAAAAVAQHHSQLKGRTELQLNMLYSRIGQADSYLNAKIAAAAGRDSTAMKTLALLGTLFLPPTFVASLFSMGMFNWTTTFPSPSNSESSSAVAKEPIVSDKFWIYWTVAIPLTVATFCAWMSWWQWEKRNFARDFRAVLSTIDRPSEEAISGLKPSPTAVFNFRGLLRQRMGKNRGEVE